uniref:Peptidase A2 domain-containing protein n=1 Tax=Glossina pallidipes TaxID=7398 RepID=A0A1A9ZBD9_GLOPL
MSAGSDRDQDCCLNADMSFNAETLNLGEFARNLISADQLCKSVRAGDVFKALHVKLTNISACTVAAALKNSAAVPRAAATAVGPASPADASVATAATAFIVARKWQRQSVATDDVVEVKLHDDFRGVFEWSVVKERRISLFSKTVKHHKLECKTIIHRSHLLQLHAKAERGKWQRTPPTNPTTNSNTNNILDLMFYNNNTQQNTDTSAHNTHNIRTLNFNEHLSTIRKIFARSVKLPLFWSPSTVKHSLYNLAHSSRLKVLSKDITKYEHVLIALPQETILSVLDFIRDLSTANNYNGLKKILSERYFQLLIDSGGDISVLPALTFFNKKNSCDIVLIAANGCSIRTYGQKLLHTHLNFRREFPFIFLIADISKSTIGARFLKKYGLLIDIKNKQFN